MGQQQLLLIVLGVILVGVAVVLGIQYFGVGAEEGAKDELVAHCQAIAANAQQWYAKPVSMGGGGGAFTALYNTVNGPWAIPADLETTSNAGHINDQGVVVDAGYVAAIGDQQVTITATPNNPDYNWTVVCTVDPTKAKCVVTPGS